jgi:hypothetical protein
MGKKKPRTQDDEKRLEGQRDRKNRSNMKARKDLANRVGAGVIGLRRLMVLLQHCKGALPDTPANKKLLGEVKMMDIELKAMAFNITGFIGRHSVFLPVECVAVGDAMRMQGVVDPTMPPRPIYFKDQDRREGLFVKKQQQQQPEAQLPPLAPEAPYDVACEAAAADAFLSSGAPPLPETPGDADAFDPADFSMPMPLAECANVDMVLALMNLSRS